MKWNCCDNCLLTVRSPSLRGRGLKFTNGQFYRFYTDVALFTRAWIEIHVLPIITVPFTESPSLRGRGLKYQVICFKRAAIVVALFTRAWIEMVRLYLYRRLRKVALFTRAWIEMYVSPCSSIHSPVALFTRAWIEILLC